MRFKSPRAFRQFSVIALCLLCLAASAATNATPDSRTQIAKISAQQQAHWPTNRTINIVCHGHSVPAGYFHTPVVDTFNSYPHLLHRELKERFPNAVINVIVTAIGGENSESGAKRFERDVLSLRPDVITIDYSLNDRRIGLAKAKTAWTTMIEQARARRIPVILLTPTPDQRAKRDDPKDPLNQHAEQVRQLAREGHLGLVDSAAAFDEKVRSGVPLPDLMSHVNHPNRRGHELVAAELAKCFQSSPEASGQK